jgi:hypothetical protein
MLTHHDRDQGNAFPTKNCTTTLRVHRKENLQNGFYSSLIL